MPVEPIPGVEPVPKPLVFTKFLLDILGVSDPEQIKAMARAAFPHQEEQPTLARLVVGAEPATPPQQVRVHVRRT
jgi:hypothetical protein